MRKLSLCVAAVSVAFFGLTGCDDGGDDAAGAAGSGGGQMFMPRDGGAGAAGGEGGSGGVGGTGGGVGGSGGGVGGTGGGAGGTGGGAGGMGGGAGGMGGTGGGAGGAGGGSSIPQSGEVVITEIMFDPHNGLQDQFAEFIEIHNPSDAPFSLEDCILSDGTGEVPAGEVTIEPGGYVVYARSDDANVNGGLNAVGVFDFSLNNSRDRIALTCGDRLVDQVRYDFDEGYPRARGFSMSLAPGHEMANHNDTAEHWCFSRRVYLEDPVQWGTPGAANSPCDEATDFCRLQWPLEIPNEDIAGHYGDEVMIYGRVYEPGVTDRSPGIDGYGMVRGYLGFGPEGTQPENNEDWIWIWARPNDGFDANMAGEPNNDEYMARLYVPVPGAYDFAFRFSVDGGRSWLHCDGGEAGSSDGYDVANAGSMSPIPPVAPCDPNPCNRPPVSECQGDIAVSYGDAGQCDVADDGLAACAYPAAQTDCGANGQVCVFGRCYDQRPQVPAAGEVIISEIMYNPDDPDFEEAIGREQLRESNAEWIEVYNTTGQALNLDGCELTDFNADRATPESPTAIEGMIVEGTGYSLFVRSDDLSRNGGLRADHRFYFNLTNGGDTIILRCNGVEIDRVTYVDGAGPRGTARARSLSLDANAMDAQTNDIDGAWCLGEAQYLDTPPHRGTPGGPNPVCARCVENHCITPPARRCDGDTAVSYAPVGMCNVMGIEETCDYAENREDCADGYACLHGYCAPAGAAAPEAGAVIINEIMFDPNGDLADARAEWIELYNVGGSAVSLHDCQINDATASSALEGVFLATDGYALLARSLDGGENGGLVPNGLFGFSLNNAGDTLSIQCGETMIDTVAYSAEMGFPRAAGASIQLDPTQANAEGNDAGLSWCAADQAYLNEPAQFGTPGSPNSACGGQ